LTVEEVDYLRSPPWPVTAPGVSLHRCRLPAYANDPANWVAGPPTPGTADADGDGLPDGWELANGLDPLRVAGQDGAEGDPDGDGYSNLQEWLGGTDPQATSSRPTLEVDWGAGATVGLRFLGAPGRTYTVCWSSDLAGGAWQPLGTIRQGSLPVPATLWDTPQGATRFYRLQTQ
jgi:hypothetical protein